MLIVDSGTGGRWNSQVIPIITIARHCQVRLRSGGYPAVSASARLQILEPPLFFTPMRAETFGEFGGQVQLTCDVVGEPTPQVKWFRNAESVDAHIESGRWVKG